MGDRLLLFISVEVHRATATRLRLGDSGLALFRQLLLPEAERLDRHLEVLHEEPHDPLVRAEAPVDGTRDLVHIAETSVLDALDIESPSGLVVQPVLHDHRSTDDVDQAVAHLRREVLIRFF